MFNSTLLIALQWIINTVKINMKFRWYLWFLLTNVWWSHQQNSLVMSAVFPACTAVWISDICAVVGVTNNVFCNAESFRPSVGYQSVCGSIRNILESCQYWLLRLHFYSLCICQMRTVLLHFSQVTETVAVEFVNWSNLPPQTHEASDDLKTCKTLTALCAKHSG